MTRDNPTETPIDSPAAFETALALLVDSATTNGVDVRGAWEVKTDGTALEWDVTITELDRSSD
jgi:hypothetical protein